MKPHDSAPYTLPSITPADSIARAAALRDRLKQRRTCRYFTDAAVPREVVAAAIEAAIAIQSSWERAMDEPGGDEDFARSMVCHWEAIEAHLRTITITA